LVFERGEDDAIGAAGALADQHQPGDRKMPVDRQGREIGGGDEPLLRQFGAQEGERVALCRQACCRVILDDMLAERHFRQQLGGEGFTFLITGRPLTLSLSPLAGRWPRSLASYDAIPLLRLTAR